MKPTDEEKRAVKLALIDRLVCCDDPDAIVFAAWQAIAPLVLERAAREVEENYESTWYIADRIRALING